MLAFGFKRHGSLEVMEVFETKIPKPAEDEVLIEVKASALNHLDIWVREGWPDLKLIMPHICGSDAAGIIRECGSAVNQFIVGDRVAVDPGINTIEDEYTAVGDNSLSPGYKIIGEQIKGMHSQFISIPAKNCLKLPEHINYEDAAANGLVGVTTWRMLMRRAEMRLGQKVLIIGSGGGVNSFAIQLAKLAGCEVFTITSTQEKMKKAYGLGAHHVLNYNEDKNWIRHLRDLVDGIGFDIVVDNVGAATLKNSIKLVKRGGKIVIVGNTTGPLMELDIRYLFSKQISLIGSTMGNHNDYCRAMELLFQNKIKSVIDTSFTLKDGVQAMKHLEEGKHFGKIIINYE